MENQVTYPKPALVSETSLQELSKKSFVAEVRPQTNSKDEPIITKEPTEHGFHLQKYSIMTPVQLDPLTGISIGTRKFLNFWMREGMEGTMLNIDPSKCGVETYETPRLDEEGVWTERLLIIKEVGAVTVVETTESTKKEEVRTENAVVL